MSIERNEHVVCYVAHFPSRTIKIQYDNPEKIVKTQKGNLLVRDRSLVTSY